MPIFDIFKILQLHQIVRKYCLGKPFLSTQNNILLCQIKYFILFRILFVLII